MRAILVSDPNSLEQDIKAFRTALRGFDFVSGQRYAEFRSGDKMAEYGLAALIVGGAAAAAAKTVLARRCSSSSELAYSPRVLRSWGF